MFGFLFGSLCLFALYHVVRHDGRFGGLGGRGRRRGGLRRRFLLRRLFSRIDATPAQERVITGALSDLEEEMRGLRNHRETLRDELADALRAEDLSSEQLEALISKHEGAFEGLRGGVVKALSEVHAALDPYQRRRLSELVEGGCHARGAL